MNDRTTRRWRYAVYVLYFALCLLMQYCTERTQFVQLITIYGGLCLLYLLMMRSFAMHQDKYLEGEMLGILLRLSIVFAIPNLTDDHFRFLWDGIIRINGFNAYWYTPEEFRLFGYIGNKPDMHQVYALLNSKQYHSIYPPFYQAIFTFGAWIAQGNLYIQLICIKVILLAFEFGTVLLLPKVLKQLNIAEYNALWYILNPLVIFELTGNMHLEGPMIFFMLASIWFLLRHKNVLSAIAFGCAIATKLWPVMLMPLFFKRLQFRGTMVYGIIAAAVAGLLLLPMLREYTHVAESLRLYFSQFEFNASIYYAIKSFIDKETQYDLLLRLQNILPVITAATIILLSLLYRKDKLIPAMLLAFTIYLFFATTVHPWYLTPLILLSALSGLRFPILWSMLIYLSYYTYITPAYIESQMLIAFEYGILAIYLIYELLKSELLDHAIMQKVITQFNLWLNMLKRKRSPTTYK